MKNKRVFVQNLQGIRGYAILLIFLSHCNFGLNETGINRTTWFGAFGVSLFIMLSGYLLLENHAGDKIDLLLYVKKKVYRFYPLHILTTMAAMPFAIKAIIHFDRTQIIALLANIALLQAWIPNSNIYFSYNAVSWYLSLTLFCVIMSPVVLKVFDFKNKTYEILKTVGILILCAIIDYTLYLFCGNTSVAHWALYIFPAVRIVEYIFGGGIWKLRKMVDTSSNLENIFGITGIVLSVIICCFSINANDELYSVLVWILPSMLLISFATSNTQLSNAVFANKVVLFFGDISFELFLFHQICIRYVSTIFNRFDVNCIPANILISAVASVAATLVWRKTWTRLPLAK